LSGLIYRKHPDTLTEVEEAGLYDYMAMMKAEPELFARFFCGGL
jgi:hypothetical protein